MDEPDNDLFTPIPPFPGKVSWRAGDGPGRDPDRHHERRMARHVERHRAQPPQRARGLSLADIVDTAVAVADAEGSDAVSMRRIAREMRVGAMSLYWWVESKDELHRLMLERVQAEAHAPQPSGDWRADVREFALNSRATLLRHPWAIDFLGSGPPSGPNDARNTERMLAAFDGFGLDAVTIMRFAMTLATYVFGAALREVQEIRWHQAANEAMAGMSSDERAGFYAEFDRRVRGAGRYPHLVTMLDSGIDPDAPETRDERFEFGLDCVIDGIAARIPSRPAACPPPGGPPSPPGAASPPEVHE